VGFVGGGVGENLVPGLQVNGIDTARATCLFDTLVFPKPNLDWEPALAEEFIPNKDASVWTIRLRQGVVWHDGKPFTADDVIYTLRKTGAAKSTWGGKATADLMKLNELKKLDPHTLRVPLHSPIAELPGYLYHPVMSIVQNGQTNFAKPVGTGPFAFESFAAGRNSVFRRNPNYWRDHQPYVDSVECISIADSSARFNALASGQIDAMENLSFAQAQQLHGNGTLVVLQGNGPVMVPITMAADLKPFSDVRVRQAFRLIANRPQLLQQAQLGYGTLGNDLYGKGLKYYNNELPQRHQDIEKAKSLLKQAGYPSLNVTMYSSSYQPGMLESATVFAQQAKAAGVTVQVNNGPADTYFTDHYLKAPFMQSYWAPVPLPTWMSQAVMSSSQWNETHWKKQSFDKLVKQATGELNETRARDLWYEVQSILWNQGGYLIWGYQPFLDGLAKKVHGAHASGAQPLGDYRFSEWWLA
jgi:peptide/nickel transport system substrate-binding protein